MNYQEAVALYEKNPTKENLNKIVKDLTHEMKLGEKIRMVRGHAFMQTAKDFILHGRYYNCHPYNAGGCKRLGVPMVKFTDGPRGIVLEHSTCFPVSMARGAAFDDELEYEIGEVLAKEAIAGKANYFAGICINLLRNPKWGRAQETYGEDPFLLGKMGAALTRAVQDNGVIACPKHFALNSIEDLRFSADVKCDDRTLFDVYLPHFKKCIDAGALSIMGAYNKYNGTYCCENKKLLTDILRDKWGFDGFTISDFVFGVYDISRSIKAGLDIEMPYILRSLFIRSALKKGDLKEEELDLAIERILSVLIRILPKQKSYDKSVILSKAHTELSRRAAVEGTVLLKNEDNVLPLKENKKIAVIGRYADKINVGDHGSSNVYSPYTVTAYEGIKNRFGEKNVSLYKGCDPEKAKAAAQGADYIVVCVGSDYKQEGEFLINLGDIKKKPQNKGGDRVSLLIPKEDVELIKALSLTGKKLIVNIMGGSAYVINEWKELADAIVMSFYSGLEGGNALADILSGDENPAGRLPFTIAKKESDYPAFLHIEDSTREIDYGYYHGYTLFDKKNIVPEYPFGFGLSYTSFEFKDAQMDFDDKLINITLDVENTGKRDGDEVIEIYVSSDRKNVDRPVKLLKGFKRVNIKSGETKKVTVPVEIDDLKFYNPESGNMELDESYTIYVGNDSRNIKAIGTYKSF